MDIVSLTRDGKWWRYSANEVGPSDAVPIPYGARTASVQISGMSGNVTVEYTLSSEADVKADTANWHAWSIGATSKNSGQSFDSPVTFVRTTASGSRAHKLEVLV